MTKYPEIPKEQWPKRIHLISSGEIIPQSEIKSVHFVSFTPRRQIYVVFKSGVWERQQLLAEFYEEKNEWLMHHPNN